MPKATELVQGTLALLIMRVVAREPLHGWAVAKRIELLSHNALQVQQGSLYPALHRLEQQGWIKAAWAETDLGRNAKFYSLTKQGRTALQKEESNWSRPSAAVNLVIQNT